MRGLHICTQITHEMYRNIICTACFSHGVLDKLAERQGLIAYKHYEMMQ